MFHLVDFIFDGMSYWPPYTSTERCTRAVKCQEAPDENCGLFDTHEEARCKLPMAVVQSDLQTEEEDDRPAYMKRKGITNMIKKIHFSVDGLTIQHMFTLLVILSNLIFLTSGAQIRKCSVPLKVRIRSQWKSFYARASQTPLRVYLTDLRLPMSSLENLRRVEGQLSDQDLKNYLIIYLGLFGGMTTKKNVWRILSKLLTNGLAMKMNWKQAFEPLALKSFVIGKTPKKHSRGHELMVLFYTVPGRDGSRGIRYWSI
uniref:Uncharacterized protein n=1 Tax=Salmo trutta TaxID=8032 RepID=A0A673XHQ5_SALTR